MQLHMSCDVPYTNSLLAKDAIYETRLVTYSQKPNKWGGPNNQRGWKNIRNLINGGSKYTGGLEI